MAEPMLMGTSLSDDPLTALPLARRRYLEASRQIEDLQSQQPDFSQAQEYARRQGDLGKTSLLNALAAQYAGEGFQPLQAKFLRQAEASQQPLRIGSTMILPTGEVVRDPNAERTQRLGALERRADVAAGDIRLLETAAERRAENARLQQERLDAKREADERNLKHQEAMARLTASLRQPAGGRAAAPAEVSTDSTSPFIRIIDPNINLRSAMGAQGVIERRLDNIANLIGGGDPNAASRNATANLEALHTQTIAAMSAAFPGRESVHLMQLLDQHAIKPGQWFTGIASVAPKARANIAILQDAQNRLAQGVAINTTPAGKAKIQQDLMRIRSLLADYQNLLKAAESQTTTAAPQIAPRGQPAAATGGRLTPAEEQELAALRARFGKQP